MDDHELEQRLQELPGELLKALWANIGNNVRRLRQAQNLTQEELSGMMGNRHGLSVRTIIRLEKGRSVSDETLKCIAGALNIDIDRLKDFNFTSGDRESEKDILEKVARANDIHLPIVIFERLSDARSLIATMNGTDGISKPIFESLVGDDEEDAALTFAGILDKYAPEYPDLDLAGKVNFRRKLDTGLDLLKQFGFVLYGVVLKVPTAGKVTFGTKKFLVLRMNRQDVPFVADFVPDTFRIAE